MSNMATVRAPVASITDIDLLLIGKTGNGKSATGNSILRRRAFVSKSSTSSVTKVADSEITDFNGRIIKVVDGPGIGDTRMNTEAAINSVKGAIQYAIAANPRGYHAFLLVVRFGGRFTDEDKDTIELLKKLFGYDFVEKFCILVMTCGENFEQDNEETGKTFQEWCDEQEGVFKNLYLECNRRAVLFDNATKCEKTKQKQITELLKIVDRLASKGLRYTDANFALAETARRKLVIESRLPVIEEKTEKETSLILFHAQALLYETNLKVKEKKLLDLCGRADALYADLIVQDRGTGALSQLCATVKSLKESLRDDWKFYTKMIDEERQQKMREDNIKQQHQEKMRKQEEEFKKKVASERREINKKQEEQRRLQLEKEHEKKIKIAEKDKQREIEILKQKLEKEKEEEIKKQLLMLTRLEMEYRKAKMENNSDAMNKIVRSLTDTWPFKKISSWLIK